MASTPPGPKPPAADPGTAPADTFLNTAQPSTDTAGPEVTAVLPQPTSAPDPLAPTSPQAPAAGPPAAEGPSAPALADEAQKKNLSTLRDFRLLKKLGEGGMGTVYKAHQISLDRTVAVKVPFKHLAKDPGVVQRFYREARVMAKLDHPNILRCFSVGEENGWHYLAMEFIDGVSMQSWLQKLGKLSVADAVHVTLACAYALRHAHEQGIIHRDIKPDNILITSKGAVKVADMGLAKALEDDLSLSRTGTGAGTPHYMAPEQARDAKHVDGRSDIYALGTMLYCFLTGKPPFHAETYVELLLEKEKGKYPPTRRSNAEIPERLDLVIDKAVAVKPEFRYQTCADFIKDLEALGLAGETLSFIPGAVPASQAMVMSAPTRVAAAAPTRAGAKPPPPKPSVRAGADTWYLRTVTDKGKYLKRKLTTLQIAELIKDKSFDLQDATASRDLKGPYRNLAHYKEFESALAGRLVQAKAERSAAKFQGMYQNILKDEKAFYRRRWLKNKLRSAGGMASFALFLAAIAGAVFVVLKYVLKLF